MVPHSHSENKKRRGIGVPSGSRTNHGACRDQPGAQASPRALQQSSAGRAARQPAGSPLLRPTVRERGPLRLRTAVQASTTASKPSSPAPHQNDALAHDQASIFPSLLKRPRPASMRGLQLQTVSAARHTHHFAPSPLMSVDILMVGTPVPDLLVPDSNRVPFAGPAHLMLVKAHLRFLRCRLSAITVTGTIPQYQLNPRPLLQGRSTNAENSYGH